MYDNRAHAFYCDECPEVFTSEDDDAEEFAAIWAEAKSAGWIAYKEGQEWVHLCPNCRDK